MLAQNMCCPENYILRFYTLPLMPHSLLSFYCHICMAAMMGRNLEALQNLCSMNPKICSDISNHFASHARKATIVYLLIQLRNNAPLRKEQPLCSAPQNVLKNLKTGSLRHTVLGQKFSQIIPIEWTPVWFGSFDSLYLTITAILTENTRSAILFYFKYCFFKYWGRYVLLQETPASQKAHLVQEIFIE